MRIISLGIDYQDRKLDVEVEYSSSRRGGVEIEDIRVWDDDVERPDVAEVLFSKIADKFYNVMADPIDIEEDL